MSETVRVEKLVHGGQGIGSLVDGRKVFVWNALPGELVSVRIIKRKHSYAEAVAEDIIEVSPERINPKESNYLSTSPWQIMSFEAENRFKKEVVTELFNQFDVTIPKFIMTTKGKEWHYRNKMEYSFWGDDQGLHLALHNRGSHQKQIVSGSELAMTYIDEGAQAILLELQKSNVRAGDLKTIIVRSNQTGDVVVSLFVKDENLIKLTLPVNIKGLRVYYSNPKSPASVATKLLYELGDTKIQDRLLGQLFTYDVDSFFQVNLPIFEEVIKTIKRYSHDRDLVDMYAGVGSIGLSVASKKVELVEIEEHTAEMARVNARASHLEADVVKASAEESLDYIQENKSIIFDPPRAGLHNKVVERVLNVKPPQIIYLSCNPATQARDLSKLQGVYRVDYFEAFNFFPRTPHIETLAILSKNT